MPGGNFQRFDFYIFAKRAILIIYTVVVTIVTLTLPGGGRPEGGACGAVVRWGGREGVGNSMHSSSSRDGVCVTLDREFLAPLLLIYYCRRPFFLVKCQGIKTNRTV